MDPFPARLFRIASRLWHATCLHEVPGGEVSNSKSPHLPAYVELEPHTAYAEELAPNPSLHSKMTWSAKTGTEDVDSLLTFASLLLSEYFVSEAALSSYVREHGIGMQYLSRPDMSPSSPHVDVKFAPKEPFPLASI
jgi:hypothetical protein